MKRAHVVSGLDRIASIDDKLRGKRIGLMTNPSAVDINLRSAVDIIHSKYRLEALYACEHGLLGTQQAGAPVSGSKDPRTGARVFRAYGGDDHIEAGGLDGIDVFVYDMQQIGARFYTRLYALAYAMMDCAKRGIPVVVLDRVNPITGTAVSGTIIEPRYHSFVGNFGLATRFGLTVGEYASYVADDCGLDIALTVVPVDGWRRWMYFDETNLPWVATSPNIPALSSAILFVGTCLFEGTNLSEGRGTTLPFEIVGAPWIDSDDLAGEMRAMRLPGMGFRAANFVPCFSKHTGTQCNGVQMHVLDRETADPVQAGLMLCEVIRAMYPKAFKWLGSEGQQGETANRLIGTDTFTSGRYNTRALLAAHAPGIADFTRTTQKYHLYD